MEQEVIQRTKGSKKEENALLWYCNAQAMPGRAVRDLDALYNRKENLETISD